MREGALDRQTQIQAHRCLTIERNTTIHISPSPKKHIYGNPTLEIIQHRLREQSEIVPRVDLEQHTPTSHLIRVNVELTWAADTTPVSFLTRHKHLCGISELIFTHNKRVSSGFEAKKVDQPDDGRKTLRLHGHDLADVVSKMCGRQTDGL